MTLTLGNDFSSVFYRSAINTWGNTSHEPSKGFRYEVAYIIQMKLSTKWTRNTYSIALLAQ